MPSWYLHLRRPALGIALVLTLAWFVVTHLPQDRAARLNILVYDWLAHGMGYMVMTACWLTWAQTRFQARPARMAARVWLAIVLLGAVDEVTQPLVGRSCSLMDWISDAVGAMIAVSITPILLRRFALPSGKEEMLDHVHDRVDVPEHHPERDNP